MNFKNVTCICMPDRPKKRDFLQAQIHDYFGNIDVDWVDAVNTRHLKNHHVGCALSHRKVIQKAKDNNYDNILVFEEDAIMHNQINLYIDNIYDELADIEWDILYLGACVWDPKKGPSRQFDRIPKRNHLVRVTGSTCTHGIAYNSTCYDYLLNELPGDIDGMREWCKINAAIDQWFMYHFQGLRSDSIPGSKKINGVTFNCLMADPRVVSQPFLIADHKQDSPKDFPTMKDYMDDRLKE